MYCKKIKNIYFKHTNCIFAMVPTENNWDIIMKLWLECTELQYCWNLICIKSGIVRSHSLSRSLTVNICWSAIIKMAHISMGIINFCNQITTDIFSWNVLPITASVVMFGLRIFRTMNTNQGKLFFRYAVCCVFD